MGDCLTFHYDSGRLGQGDGAPPISAWSRFLSVSLGSAVRGAPLFLQGWVFQGGPHAGETHNMVYVATSDNYVNAYAEDALLAHNTTPLWTVHPGPAVTRAGSNIPPPIGICSTPVLDPVNSRLFVCSYQDAGGGQSIYIMYCLDLDTGVTIQSATLSDPGGAGRPTFDANLVDQRGALNLVNGRVYATFAAFYGYDEGNYHGWLVGCNANNLHSQWYFPTTRNMLAGGCWGPGGAAAAPDGSLYIATGNATWPGNTPQQQTANENAYWNGLAASQHPGDLGDLFMAVVKVGVVWMGYTGHLTTLDWFQPTNARALNDADLDLGSSSCMVLPDIGGRQLVVVSAKNDIYVLDRNNLGHWGAPLWSAHVFGSESHSAPAYYLTPTGDHNVYFSGGNLPGLICYRVDANSGGASLTEIWRATGSGVAFTEACSSPTIGSITSPSHFALVWIADDGALHAYNALDGTEVYNSSNVAADAPGPLPHYPPVTCAGSSVYVGTNDGFALYRAIHKRWKELKPEIKEHKDFKPEFKEVHKELIKPEIDLKQVIEIPKLKDNEGDPRQRFGDDPYAVLRVIAERLDQIEERLATGKAFIRPEERPRLSDSPFGEKKSPKKDESSNE